MSLVRRSRREMHDAATPAPGLLRRQAEWLSGARARLLRRANIANRRVVVDLGAGSCAVSAELARRSGGAVIAIDANVNGLCDIDDADEGNNCQSVARICALAEALPLADASVDLVFVQCGFLWFAESERVAAEIARVLRPGGALAAIEPDYGGMIEHPPKIASKDVWIAALLRCGADPYIGRKLPGILAGVGFSVDVQLLERLESPRAERFELLEELPLTGEEAERVRVAREFSGPKTGANVVHLPFLMVLDERRW